MVPIPEESRATDGLSPVKKGTRTVAPYHNSFHFDKRLFISCVKLHVKVDGRRFIPEGLC